MLAIGGFYHFRTKAHNGFSRKLAYPLHYNHIKSTSPRRLLVWLEVKRFTHESTNKRMEEQTDASKCIISLGTLTDRRMDGRTDGRTDGQTLPSTLSPCFAKATRSIINKSNTVQQYCKQLVLNSTLSYIKSHKELPLLGEGNNF